jgi:hypothetical protein
VIANGKTRAVGHQLPPGPITLLYDSVNLICKSTLRWISLTILIPDVLTRGALSAEEQAGALLCRVHGKKGLSEKEKKRAEGCPGAQMLLSLSLSVCLWCL